MTARRPGRRLGAAAVVLMLLVGMLAAASTVAVPPAIAAGPCVGNGLYDQTAKRGRTPIPDAAGHVYPVVTIHGITGSDQDFDNTIDLSYIDANPKPPRSLLDAFAGPKVAGQALPPGLPHVHVYSFSYTSDSLRWVDDPRVGGKFAAAVDCLYQAYGVPISVVAHSLGGLVTRWVANTSDASGRSRATKLGKVITLGTPYQGSLSAEAASDAEALAATNPAFAPTIWALRNFCGGLGTNTGNGACAGIPMLSSLNSQAGQALRLGSAKIKALARWPAGMDVAALAGSIKVPFYLIGSPFNAPVDLGDLAVTTDSATADPGATRTFECRYDSASGTPATEFKKLLGLASPQERQAEFGRLLTGGPCYHSHLMRNVELTNEVLGQLNDWITATSAAASCGLIAPDIGFAAANVAVDQCAQGWAIIRDPSGLGDTERLVRLVSGKWQVITGFPSSMCVDEIAKMGAPPFVQQHFNMCDGQAVPSRAPTTCLNNDQATQLFVNSPAQAITGQERVNVAFCMNGWAIGAVLSSNDMEFASVAYQYLGGGWQYVVSAGPLSLFCDDLRSHSAPSAVLNDPRSACSG